jgi:hypothetical protein
MGYQSAEILLEQSRAQPSKAGLREATRADAFQLWSRRSGVRVPSLTLSKRLQIVGFLDFASSVTMDLGSNWGRAADRE